MKAVLLAAGFGTRLRPITDSMPKCLVPIGDKPLLGHWLDSLFNVGIASVLINLHYRSDQVRKYVATRVDKDKIFLAEESKLWELPEQFAKIKSILMAINRSLFMQIIFVMPI